MLQRSFQIAFWAAVLFALVMATLPAPPQLGQSDKVQHILAFTVMMALGMLAHPTLSPIRLGLCLSAFGVAIELLQRIPALNRDSDVNDWLADTLAIVAVMLIVSLARRWRRRRAAAA